MKLVLACLAAVGCVTEPTTTVQPAATLVEMEPTLYLRSTTSAIGDDLIELDLLAPGCHRLASGTATIEGRPGQPVAGGGSVTTIPDELHPPETFCTAAGFFWARKVLPAGPLTVVVADAEIELAVRVDPSAPVFSVAPGVYHPGDVVVVHASGGELSSPSVTASTATGTHLFTIDAPAVEGHEIRFTIPADLATEAAATLRIGAYAAPELLACDSPWQCSAERRFVQHTTAITITSAPPAP